jgi:hypothetical protein
MPLGGRARRRRRKRRKKVKEGEEGERKKEKRKKKEDSSLSGQEPPATETVPLPIDTEKVKLLLHSPK